MKASELTPTQARNLRREAAAYSESGRVKITAAQIIERIAAPTQDEISRAGCELFDEAAKRAADEAEARFLAPIPKAKGRVIRRACRMRLTAEDLASAFETIASGKQPPSRAKIVQSVLKGLNFDVMPEAWLPRGWNVHPVDRLRDLRAAAQGLSALGAR